MAKQRYMSEAGMIAMAVRLGILTCIIYAIVMLVGAG